MPFVTIEWSMSALSDPFDLFQHSFARLHAPAESHLQGRRPTNGLKTIRENLVPTLLDRPKQLTDGLRELRHYGIQPGGGRGPVRRILLLHNNVTYSVSTFQQEERARRII